VARGRIGIYGVSSNTSVAPPDSREATDLSRMLEAARRAGGENHRFRVLQLPMNLLETGAHFERGTTGESVLEVARKRGIAVLVNRPLNAIRDDGIARLADPPTFSGTAAFDPALERVRALEQEFRLDFVPSLRTAPGGPPPEALLAWADQLARLPAGVRTLAQWNDVEAQVVTPRTAQVLRALDRALGERWSEFRDRYVDALEQLLLAIRARAAEGSRAQAASLHRALDTVIPEAQRAESLSRKALWVLASTPGVTSVLVGMRSPEYVEDAIAVQSWKSLDDPAAALRAAAEAHV
jgi:aryl-alcohol dehydrogenase-like predicted oxidoreductase